MEVLVSSTEDNETIIVKFWNDKIAHSNHIMAGQEVMAYALVTFFRNKVELTTTNETVIQVS